VKKIFSKIKKKKLLHIIFSPSKKNQRINISPDGEFMQLCYLNLNKENKFLPHKHFWKINKEKKKIVQESWLLIKGSAKVSFYDLDDKFLISKILKPGDVSITFAGGHKLDILKNDTIIYEHKNGPYEGQKKDLKYLI
jgi:hypothetical protein|tara:strand:+ start:16 stop:429 length:414 start_codon:yes stop_codon:yes gene_type:complete